MEQVVVSYFVFCGARLAVVALTAGSDKAVPKF
jgi:hypothetical protein